MNRYLLLPALLLALLNVGAMGQTKVPREGTVTAGNAFYNVHVQNIRGSGVGLYTATTGPSHPAGEGLNVLFGGGNPGTSFTTIRSYTTGTDYIQDNGKSSANATVFLDPFGEVTPIGTTGFRTTYNLPGGTTTPDALTIHQDVNVNGTTFDDSTIEVTTTIINNGISTVRVGVRYHWDYQIGSDDGPVFQPIGSFDVFGRGCDEFITEAEFADPRFTAYRIEDNDVNPNPPTFNIFGTVVGPGTVSPVPTPPDLLQNVCWPSANGTAFEYTVDPSRDVSTAASDCQTGTGGGDTAVHYFFGSDNSRALTIPAGGSITVSASLFLRPIAPPPDVGCITRTARFWFSHPESEDPACVTLRKAIESNCEVLNLGFLGLPRGFHTDDNVRDGDDALIEALGLFWRSSKKTGETGGTQNQKLRGSALCRARKQLAAELIAALANTQLFGTDPASCTYLNGGTVTNFPADLLARARTAAAGHRIEDVRVMTALLRKFNASGVLSALPNGLTECSAQPSKFLRQLSRDPTTQANCPGENNTCETAEAVVFPDTSDPFVRAVFQREVDLNRFTNAIRAPSCGAGGRDAVWRILPTVGVEGRRFTVDTFGSNFDTMVSVWRGDCDALVPVDCNDDAGLSVQSQLSFTTDGTNTYYVVVEGPSGQYGKLKLKITSP